MCIGDGSSIPLPAVYKGPVYHYTNSIGAKGIIESGCLWASHCQAMNDPGEFNYGWNFIRDYYREHQSRFGSDVSDVLEEIFLPETMPVPKNLYILCGSTEKGDLNQFRLYGGIQLGLQNREWHALDGIPPLHNSGLCRQAIYNADPSKSYSERLLRYAEETIRRDLECDGSLHPEGRDPEPIGTRAHVAIYQGALYLKHPAYKTENEIRIVIPDIWGAQAKVRTRNGALVKYLEVQHSVNKGSCRHGEDAVVRSVMVGPGADQEVTCSALEHMMDIFGDGKNPIPVVASDLPYR